MHIVIQTCSTSCRQTFWFQYLGDLRKILYASRVTTMYREFMAYVTEKVCAALASEKICNKIWAVFYFIRNTTRMNSTINHGGEKRLINKTPWTMIRTVRKKKVICLKVSNCFFVFFKHHVIKFFFLSFFVILFGKFSSHFFSYHAFHSGRHSHQ